MIEMIIGSYEKSSLKLPKKFSSLFGKDYVLATEDEPCLIILDLENCKKINTSDLKFWGGISINEEGEILVPSWIKRKIFEKLNIKRGDILVFVGCVNRVEIWKKDDWEAFKNKYNYEEILERFFYGQEIQKGVSEKGGM